MKNLYHNNHDIYRLSFILPKRMAFLDPGKPSPEQPTEAVDSQKPGITKENYLKAYNDTTEILGAIISGEAFNGPKSIEILKGLKPDQQEKLKKSADTAKKLIEGSVADPASVEAMMDNDQGKLFLEKQLNKMNEICAKNLNYGKDTDSKSGESQNTALPTVQDSDANNGLVNAISSEVTATDQLEKAAKAREDFDQAFLKLGAATAENRAKYNLGGEVFMALSGAMRTKAAEVKASNDPAMIQQKTADLQLYLKNLPEYVRKGRALDAVSNVAESVLSLKYTNNSDQEWSKRLQRALKDNQSEIFKQIYEDEQFPINYNGFIGMATRGENGNWIVTVENKNPPATKTAEILEAKTEDPEVLLKTFAELRNEKTALIKELPGFNALPAAKNLLAGLQKIDADLTQNLKGSFTDPEKINVIKNAAKAVEELMLPQQEKIKRYQKLKDNITNAVKTVLAKAAGGQLDATGKNMGEAGSLEFRIENALQAFPDLLRAPDGTRWDVVISPTFTVSVIKNAFATQILIPTHS